LQTQEGLVRDLWWIALATFIAITFIASRFEKMMRESLSWQREQLQATRESKDLLLGIRDHAWTIARAVDQPNDPPPKWLFEDRGS
jgi:hypothetical protein